MTAAGQEVLVPPSHLAGPAIAPLTEWGRGAKVRLFGSPSFEVRLFGSPSFEVLPEEEGCTGKTERRGA